MYSLELEKSELAISTVMKKEDRPIDVGSPEKTTSHVGGDDFNDVQVIVEFADWYVPIASAHESACTCCRSKKNIMRRMRPD